jgi:hypothetical protein
LGEGLLGVGTGLGFGLELVLFGLVLRYWVGIGIGVWYWGWYCWNWGCRFGLGLGGAAWGWDFSGAEGRGFVFRVLSDAFVLLQKLDDSEVLSHIVLIKAKTSHRTGCNYSGAPHLPIIIGKRFVSLYLS